MCVCVFSSLGLIFILVFSSLGMDFLLIGFIQFRCGNFGFTIEDILLLNFGDFKSELGGF